MTRTAQQSEPSAPAELPSKPVDANGEAPQHSSAEEAVEKKKKDRDEKRKKKGAKKVSFSAEAVAAAIGPGGGKKARKPHRFRPGTRALMEIRKLQKGTDFLMKKAPFYRLIREVANEVKEDLRFKEDALIALMEASQSYLIQYLEGAYRVTVHGKR